MLIALVVQRIERYLDDGPIEVVLSIMVPYVAYLAAQAANASAVLSVVACGLYLGRRESQLFSPSVRLQANYFWSAFTFALNGLVFVLIGLQLPFVLAGIHDYPMRTLLLYGGAFSVLVIALRLAWVYPGAYTGYWIRRHIFPPGNRISASARGLYRRVGRHARRHRPRRGIGITGGHR